MNSNEQFTQETLNVHTSDIGGIKAQLAALELRVNQFSEESKKDRQHLHTKIDLVLTELSVTKTLIKALKLIGTIIIALVLLKLGDANTALKELVKLFF